MLVVLPNGVNRRAFKLVLAPRKLGETIGEDFTAMHPAELMEICGDFSGDVTTSSENQLDFKTFLS